MPPDADVIEVSARLEDARPFHPATSPAVLARAARDRAAGKMRYASLVLTITDRCNIKCDFCCHPFMESEIPAEAARAMVRQARAAGMDEIGITGGEPFLRRGLLVELARIAKADDLDFGVISNGYWARSETKARAWLGELVEAGLTRLTISWDPSHGAFVPAATANTAIVVASELGLRVCLTGSFKTPGETHADHGFDLDGLRRYRNFKDVSALAAPAGNGACLDDLPAPAGVDFATTAARCPSQYQPQLVVYPRHGLTQPCCSIFAGYKLRQLALGDWRTVSIADLRTRQRGDPFLTIISEAGFRGLYAIVEAADPALAATLPDPASVQDPCALCAKVMTGDRGARVRAIADDYATARIAAMMAEGNGR